MNATWKPNYYHGNRKKRKFFESWYYKLVDSDGKNVLVIIPGVVKGVTDGQHFAYIRILSEENSSLIKYGINDLRAEKRSFNFQLDKNYFSLGECKLNINSQKFQLLGTLNFVDQIEWPGSLFNPGSIGFYNFVPFMECRNQVSCLNGTIAGKLLINGIEIDYTGGKVYIEKNWGKRHPKKYFRTQTNSFKSKDISFTCTIARFKIFKFPLTGFIAAITHRGQVYKFTSINRTKIKTTYDKNNITLNFTKEDLQLNVEINFKDTDFLKYESQPFDKQKESLTCKLNLELINIFKERIIFSEFSECASINMIGDLHTI